ncbi:alpha-amylase family glycosyl hydrolase [Tamlana sp. 2201CG12-4]|uniref:alpha-amylase family glycosyl hydrolase n=1 Tax=Tamlana sp. 2201CG12-4 TaxID=3112582 RepID=UPI002DBB4CAF|nr:alpha-amylase family glycosyl hydrolase [Tamlana sp. 2201CG12-4]MEC3906758.1 alpha-amylase family glycosyl hydrolase [Tamlana sp. 2201CG12-4]
MKKLIRLAFILIGFSATAQVTITPNAFEVTDEITITVDINSTATDCSSFNAPNKVYMHSGIGDDANAFGFDVIGNWGQDDGVGQMTDNGNGTYSITITPSTYYNITTEQQNTATQLGMVFRNESGSQEFKASGCSDFFFDLGAFQLFLDSPTHTTTILNAGETILINATSSLTADFTLLANNVIVDTDTQTTTYTNTYTVNETTNFKLQITNGTDTDSKTFQVIVKPTVTESPLPANLLDGINYNTLDATKATLVLYAPEKDFVHVIGDFNNWTVDDTYLMKKDSSKDRFWIELTGLTPQSNHTYQYLVDATIRVADPYSPVILTESNDQFINSTTYPDLPAYPTGETNHSVTLLRTGDTPYNWEVPDFNAPEKTDLVIYEFLIRDFDALHSFDAVKDRLDYLENLGVNAIEFMPLNEFDGNESWGYNPSFHMALDKYYGTQNAFKALIDECHKRGIAIIVDVVFNHASGQHPYYRLWNTDNGNYGGTASANSPFFNQTAKHAYSVFNDFNHSTQATRDYVKRVSQFWINEYNVDGFRWDLTKGFTQNCTASDEGCTGSYQQDRVDVLKLYADDQWEINEDFYVIFEHLGGITEEKEWADYRVNEGKGIMLWNNLNHDYSSATEGNASSNFDRISYKKKGFAQASSAIGYMESHDEERMMYRNLNSDKSNGSYSVKDLNTGLQRTETAGAFFFTVPGPKMIWQFGELGYDVSIDQGGRTGNKPIRWEYFDDANRKAIYNTWSELIRLKLEQPIFNTTNFEIDAGKSNGLKSIHLSLDSATGDEIKHITIIGNFGLAAQNIDPEFQQTGTWYNLLNRNTPLEVNNVNTLISLEPGTFIIYGDKPFINPEDLDSDGVLNANDQCPNTPIGAIVDANGCEIFSLPKNNFKIQISGETCRSSNNGIIDITAIEVLNYTVKITGNAFSSEDNFTTTLIKENLEAGDYEVCITVDNEPDFEMCFNVTVTQPENLSVFSKVSNTKDQVSLSMYGSSSYKVTLNGITTETSNSTIDLQLQPGENKISVETDKNCQGKYEETIFYGGEMLAYPNPVDHNNVLNVYLGALNNEPAYIEVFSVLGKRVYSHTTRNSKLIINTSDFSKGVYILKINTNTVQRNFKIIKN